MESSLEAPVTLVNKKEKSHGSGFFINNEGYIITNHHVALIDSLVAVLSDGSEYKIEIIRSDKKSDLALIKIDFNNKFCIDIESNPNTKLRDELYVLGTPKSIDLGQSITKGIVSGKRLQNDIEWIQTDAAINGGNSGGPCLLGKNIKLAGISDFKIVGRGIERLNFLIPASAIKEYLKVEYKN
jgi:S1-C subfamily serine protease